MLWIQVWVAQFVWGDWLKDMSLELKRIKKDKDLQDFQIAYFRFIQIGLGVFKNHIVFKIAYFQNICMACICLLYNAYFKSSFM